MNIIFYLFVVALAITSLVSNNITYTFIALLIVAALYFVDGDNRGG